jgi:2-succinyl-5-enolpyruvyl-6-hydroxy-3-cyclohexene-1-carboxylate synthase
MEYQNAAYAYVGVFVDELARLGIGHAVICPGSRSTPLAMSLAEHGGIRLWTLIDERSAAFFALGLAKATGKPVVLVCTSGTAAANFFPAIAEARLGRVPLLVLTADRPPELRDVGAPQAMDQIRLYGTHVKWSVEMAVPEAGPTLLRYSRMIAGRAVATALAAPAGPVHLNMPFREPLTPAPIRGAELPPSDTRDPLAWQGREHDRVFVDVQTAPRRLEQEQQQALASMLGSVERGLIVVGPQGNMALVAPLARLAATLQFPILADPLSQLRHGDVERALVIDNYDAFLRDADFVADARPDLVLRFGAMPTSKPLALFLGAIPDRAQIVVDGGTGWNDPMLVAGQVVYADEARLVEDMLTRLSPKPIVTEWARLWQETARTTRQVLAEVVPRFEAAFEGRIWTELSELLPAGTTVMVGNSMPIRDCDTFFPARTGLTRVIGNRGVNGIDGVVSTALGLAAGGERVVLVLGDLSFYHDLNGLLAAKMHDLSLTIVVVNNDGGGIFSFLPQAAYPEHFESLFGTPHGLDFRPVVEMYGGRFQRVADWNAFQRAVSASMDGSGLQVIEVKTDRQLNVSMHRHLWQVVSERLAAERAEAAG